MADEAKWYFARDGKPNGPMSQHDLCKRFGERAFTADDYVYCKGATEGWVKASTIAGLCDSLALDAEPEPEHHEVPLYERAAYDHSGDPSKKAKDKK